MTASATGYGAYEPSKQLMSFHIRGFQHWDGALVLNELKAGSTVELVGERTNPHDPDAVAIYAHGNKLGYVPADENTMISTMLFYGHEDTFEGRVLQVDPEAEPWKQVRVGIYIKDAR